MAVSESVDTGNRVCQRIDHGHPERWTRGGERQSDAGAAVVWDSPAVPSAKHDHIMGVVYCQTQVQGTWHKCNSRFWERWLCKGEQPRGGALRASKGWSDALSAVSAGSRS